MTTKTTNAALVRQHKHAAKTKERIHYNPRPRRCQTVGQAFLRGLIAGCIAAAILMPLGALERGYFAFGGDGFAAVLIGSMTFAANVDKLIEFAARRNKQ